MECYYEWLRRDLSALLDEICLRDTGTMGATCEWARGGARGAGRRGEDWDGWERALASDKVSIENFILRLA